MGPKSTVDLFCKIINATPAIKDQDHLRIIIDNNPKIPDRTAAIISGEVSPLEELLKTAKNLEKAGADFIIMPCNTAHYYYKELINSIEIPILNLIEITANALALRFPKPRTVGLLATTGTVTTKIYNKALEKVRINVLSPPPNLQKEVMKAIYRHVKAGKPEKSKKILLKVAKYLSKRGSELIICGCTEVTLALENETTPIPIIDPLQILAEKAIETALGPVKIKND